MVNGEQKPPPPSTSGQTPTTGPTPEPEEAIKQGHLFVQLLNRILKTPDTNLIHGACIGLNGKGVLLCARGQQGKSTLAVHALLDGFEYVSDDYLTLEKSRDGLLAYPIYSIVTLSPQMYNEMYEALQGTRFVSNNARRDKYVLNIANLHARFRTAYPVQVCMLPEIFPGAEPSITRCLPAEKGVRSPAWYIPPSRRWRIARHGHCEEVDRHGPDFDLQDSPADITERSLPTGFLLH